MILRTWLSCVTLATEATTQKKERWLETAFGLGKSTANPSCYIIELYKKTVLEHWLQRATDNDNRFGGGKILNWSNVQRELILPSKASVLLILDCCNASVPAENMSVYGSRGRGPKELLGACAQGEETQATWYSLRVARELWSSANYETHITSGELQRRLVRAKETETREFSWPVHCPLSEHDCGQICLRPMTPSQKTAETSKWPSWRKIFYHYHPPDSDGWGSLDRDTEWVVVKLEKPSPLSSNDMANRVDSNGLEDAAGDFEIACWDVDDLRDLDAFVNEIRW